MQCAACQATNREGAVFRRACGARLDQAAPPAALRRCPGQIPLPAMLPAPPSAARPRGDRFPGPHRAGPRLSRAARGRAQAGHRDILRHRQLDAARRARGRGGHARPAQPVLRARARQVHRYEGTINQFLGDGFMALFGAPVADEDHERRAVLAALGIPAGAGERGRPRSASGWAGRLQRSHRE